MIPVNEPIIEADAEERLEDCIESGWVSSEGDYVTEFEQRFADYIGTDHGVTCSNGTAALRLVVEALGIGEGDTVIMPSHTIISCALAVVRAGARPVLVDSEPESWQMDTDAVAEAVDADTAAIMPVHTFGHPTDMDPLLDLAEDHELAIIEDAAEAHGAEYRGERVGGIGTVGCFSFYANKLVTTGEGGMVTTDDPELAGRLRSLRSLSHSEDRRFRHEELGFNNRMTNMQAALGLTQLEHIEEHLRTKRRQRQGYLDRLGHLDQLTFQQEQDWATHTNWAFGAILDDTVPFDGDAWGQRLQDRGVETRPFFWPLHEQPALRELGLFEGEQYPVAERMARRGRYLPSGLALTEDQMDTVADAVEETLQ